MTRDEAKAKSNYITAVAHVSLPLLALLIGKVVGKEFDLEWTIALVSAAIIGLATWLFWRCIPEAEQDWDKPEKWDQPSAESNRP